MADEVRAQMSTLNEVLAGTTSSDEKEKILMGLISAEGVRAWPCDFGTCMFRPETALCHFAGKGYYDASGRRPLASERCVDLCCGCSNLLVSARHLSYWKARYRLNYELKIAYRDAGETAWGLLAARRAKVAAVILKSHGLTDLEIANAA